MTWDFRLARPACSVMYTSVIYVYVRTLRGFKACTTFGRRYCCANRNVTEAMTSSSAPFRNLLKSLSTRRVAYTRVILRKYRAYDETRRDTQTIVAIFNMVDWVDWRMRVISWRQSFSYQLTFYYSTTASAAVRNFCAWKCLDLIFFFKLNLWDGILGTVLPAREFNYDFSQESRFIISYD